MGIIETIKDVAVLVQKADNIDLVKHVLALQTQAQELIEDNRSLKEKVKELEGLLQFAKNLSFRVPFYFATGDAVPYCPRCWEVKRKAIHVVRIYESQESQETRWDCFECNQMYLIRH